MQDIADLFKSLPRERHAEVLAQLSDDQVEELSRQTEGLLDFIPRVSPELSAPNHLAPLVDVFESSLSTPRNVVISTPPQHGKTKLCLHALAWALQRAPSRRHAYVSYGVNRGHKMSVDTQKIATAAGLEWKGNQQYWHIADGGSVFATGVDSELTGEPVDGFMLIDDPIKDAVEANSAVYRERADTWLKSVAMTRMHPSASAIVVQTRWHPDDLAGRLIGRGWENINLPAISDSGGNPADDGKALWPEKRPLGFLRAKREIVGKWVWASLYQGQPRARGDAVFGDVHLYNPNTVLNGRRVAIGVDGAYTKKTYSDFSCAVVLAEWGGKYYVLHVERRRVKAPEFHALVENLKKTYSVQKTRWYSASSEMGAAQLMGVEPVLARGDKHLRAQPVAAAWNAGKVLCPEGAPWLEDFVSEMVTFTGIEDTHDDQVDALAAAFDELKTPAPSYAGLPTIHAPRRGF